MLERVNGKSISHIIKKKSWADIHYLRSMLLEACISTSCHHRLCNTRHLV